MYPTSPPHSTAASNDPRTLSTSGAAACLQPTAEPEQPRLPLFSMNKGRNKTTLLSKIATGAVVGGALFGAPREAKGNVIMTPYIDNNPEAVLAIGNTTPYRLYVLADNTGMNGEATQGFDWKFNSLNSNISSPAYGRPADERDFFGPIFYEIISPISEGSGRLALNGYAPSNKIGDLIWYDINVSADAPVGDVVISLNPDYTAAGDSWGNPQPTQLQDLVVKLRERGDVNADMIVNLEDINPFVDALIEYPYTSPLADMDGNGITNLLDINPFVDAIVGRGIASASYADIPEPGAALGLAVALAALTARRPESRTARPT